MDEAAGAGRRYLSTSHPGPWVIRPKPLVNFDELGENSPPEWLMETVFLPPADLRRTLIQVAPRLVLGEAGTPSADLRMAPIQVAPPSFPWDAGAVDAPAYVAGVVWQKLGRQMAWCLLAALWIENEAPTSLRSQAPVVERARATAPRLRAEGRDPRTVATQLADVIVLTFPPSIAIEVVRSMNTAMCDGAGNESIAGSVGGQSGITFVEEITRLSEQLKVRVDRALEVATGRPSLLDDSFIQYLLGLRGKPPGREEIAFAVAHFPSDREAQFRQYLRVGYHLARRLVAGQMGQRTPDLDAARAVLEALHDVVPPQIREDVATHALSTYICTIQQVPEQRWNSPGLLSQLAGGAEQLARAVGLKAPDPPLLE